MKKSERMSRIKTRKRIQHQQLAIRNPNSETLFAIILAALYCSSDNESYSSRNFHLINHCLNRLHRSLPQYLSPPILSLLPILLNSKSDEIACKSAELVGAASLISIEMNEMITLEDGIIMGLINLMLGSSSSDVSVAACNATLDLLTTSIGRQRLLHFSVLEKLIVCFIQEYKPFPAVVSLFSDLKGSGSCLRMVFEEEEYTVLLFHATLVLINSCTTKQLQDIPGNLSKSFINHLKRLWEEVHRMILCCTSLNYSQERHFCASNIGTNNLAESIFRLSIGNNQVEEHSNVKEIMRSIFPLGEVDFQQFILDYWEMSPLLIKGSLKDSLKQGNIFGCLVECFQSKEIPSFLLSMLKKLTSCPPIESDELNVHHFLEEARDNLGCPIIYEQDIRVVRTHYSEELHYSFRQSGSSRSEAHFFNVNDMLECEEAYNSGYTIALRGMEFRFESIAAIADGLAALFGQPSAGVNMYLTPPHSQGLSCHSDDHCVFVCQLGGVKEWNIFPRSSLQLPRLYQSNGNWPDSDPENQAVNGKLQFLLKEGDVLYIPRGFPHEARATIDEDGSARFSLHLTLAIEVEPPFAWEGFVRVALNHWCEKQGGPQRQFSDSMSWSLYITSVNLLHVAIKLIGDNDSTFRKACLVGQISLSTATEGWLSMNQRMIFNYLTSRINTESKFSDFLEFLETAVQKHEDFFQQLRWLQHLTMERDSSHGSCISSTDTRTILHFCMQHKDIVEDAFLLVKSKFCAEVLFEDVEPNYKMLLERYKRVRQQYTKGMLSLHLTS
ncbi:unnamed protein product [Coffea canephora]|uniref:Bifunctional lysine-specific demethylase and histidyl-hydroxylase n=1 Tax=Coffea canephora TaxID=49390 RepID=A0A068U5X2_COFCA|nr:unnamed protein product [Coffea canephora]